MKKPTDKRSKVLLTKLRCPRAHAAGEADGAPAEPRLRFLSLPFESLFRKKAAERPRVHRQQQPVQSLLFGEQPGNVHPSFLSFNGAPLLLMYTTKYILSTTAPDDFADVTAYTRDELHDLCAAHGFPEQADLLLADPGAFRAAFANKTDDWLRLGVPADVAPRFRLFLQQARERKDFFCRARGG